MASPMGLSERAKAGIRLVKKQSAMASIGTDLSMASRPSPRVGRGIGMSITDFPFGAAGRTSNLTLAVNAGLDFQSNCSGGSLREAPIIIAVEGRLLAKSIPLRP